MCGFAGYISPTGSPEPLAERLPPVLKALAHRGPDAQGVWISPDRRAGLAHARLSVIDPEGGAQPMTDPETGVVVAANGEIYNFKELNGEFERRGRVPRTRSDTEALLTGIALDGEDILSRLRGMFAFAAYDPRAGEVLLARDRLGQKPLFYRKLPEGGLLFASELPALLLLAGETPAPDERALSIYLSFGYIPAPWTAWSGFRKLPAGHRLRSGGGDPEPYWRRRPPEGGRGSWDPKVVAEFLRERVRDAVRVRLVSDVPLGAFLSGGIDSATVVAFMAEEASGPIRTFTVKNPHPEYDESEIARRVATRFGTDHTEITISPPEVEEIPELLKRWGEPFGDSSALATALISRAARRHVTVALTGDGGDEAFGGYDRYSILSLINRIPRLSSRTERPNMPPRIRRVLSLAGMAPWRRYYEFYESFNGGAREELLTPRFAAEWGDAPARFLEGLYNSFPGSELDRMLATDAATWLPDDLNPKVDIASMAVALECRSPLQDHLLIEACSRVPAAMHVRGWRKKALLRTAMRGLLPESVLRAKKRGFAAPVEYWFRGDLAGFLESKLRGEALRALDIVRPDAVEQVIAGLAGGGGSGRPRIQAFLLLALAVWAEGLR